VFVDVASIVSGYSMETSGNVADRFPRPMRSREQSGAGAAGKFTDRPTITYVPLTGEKFLRGFITPIDPKNIFFMLQIRLSGGLPPRADCRSLNGVRNRSTAGGAVREADPDFVRAWN